MDVSSAKDSSLLHIPPLEISDSPKQSPSPKRSKQDSPTAPGGSSSRWFSGWFRGKKSHSAAFKTSPSNQKSQQDPKDDFLVENPNAADVTTSISPSQDVPEVETTAAGEGCTESDFPVHQPPEPPQISPEQKVERVIAEESFAPKTAAVGTEVTDVKNETEKDQSEEIPASSKPRAQSANTESHSHRKHAERSSKHGSKKDGDRPSPKHKHHRRSERIFDFYDEITVESPVLTWSKGSNRNTRYGPNLSSTPEGSEVWQANVGSPPESEKVPPDGLSPIYEGLYKRTAASSAGAVPTKTSDANNNNYLREFEALYDEWQSTEYKNKQTARRSRKGLNKVVDESIPEDFESQVTPSGIDLLRTITQIGEQLDMSADKCTPHATYATENSTARSTRIAAKPTGRPSSNVETGAKEEDKQGYNCGNSIFGGTMPTGTSERRRRSSKDGSEDGNSACHSGDSLLRDIHHGSISGDHFEMDDQNVPAAQEIERTEQDELDAKEAVRLRQIRKRKATIVKETEEHVQMLEIPPEDETMMNTLQSLKTIPDVTLTTTTSERTSGMEGVLLEVEPESRSAPPVPAEEPTEESRKFESFVNNFSKIKGEKVKQFLASWMSHDIIQAQRIWDIFIPGTHDSATYEVCPRGRGFTGFVNLFVQCQDKSIIDQLESGARFLDLRTLKNTTEGLGEPYCAHGGYRTVELTRVYAEIATFLSSHPTEVILLSVRRDAGALSGENMMTLHESDFWLLLYLGQYIGPRLKGQTTVKELTQRGQQVIYFFEEVERYLPAAYCQAGIEADRGQTFEALQSMQSMTFTRIDSVFNAPKYSRRMDLIPVVDMSESIRGAKKPKGASQSAIAEEFHTPAASPSPILPPKSHTPGALSSTAGGSGSSESASDAATSQSFTEEQARITDQYMMTAGGSEMRKTVDDSAQLRPRVQGERTGDRKRGAAERLEDGQTLSEGEDLETDIIKRLKKRTADQQKGLGTRKFVSREILMQAKLIEGLEKGLPYLCRSAAAGGQTEIVCNDRMTLGYGGDLDQWEGGIPMSPSKQQQASSPSPRIPTPSDTSLKLARKLTTLASDSERFELRFKGGMLKFLDQKFLAMDKKMTTKMFEEDINSKLVKISKEDAKRFKAMKLTREFFLHPLEGSLSESKFVCVSMLKTGRTIIQKSWSQTCDNNANYLIQKLKYWTHIHGCMAPRVPYRFRVLAGEVTPPNQGSPLTSAEMMKFWGGQGLWAAFRLPAGLRTVATNCNIMLMKEMMNAETMSRVNCMTHDFCAPKLVFLMLCYGFMVQYQQK